MTQGFVEVFIESDFESVQIARQTRDRRLVQLQSEGYSCRAENLRAIDTGRWVFVLYAEAVKVEPIEVVAEELGSRPKLKPKKYYVS